MAIVTAVTAPVLTSLDISQKQFGEEKNYNTWYHLTLK